MALPPQLQQLAKPLNQFINLIIRYRLIIGLSLIVAIVAFLSFRINHYSDVQSDQQRIDDQLSQIKVVRFNNDAIEKIKSLQDNSTDVQAELPSNRTNPF